MPGCAGQLLLINWPRTTNFFEGNGHVLVELGLEHRHALGRGRELARSQARQAAYQKGRLEHDKMNPQTLDESAMQRFSERL
jgi:hypothetical protein